MIRFYNNSTLILSYFMNGSDELLLLTHPWVKNTISKHFNCYSDSRHCVHASSCWLFNINKWFFIRIIITYYTNWNGQRHGRVVCLNYFNTLLCKRCVTGLSCIEKYRYLLKYLKALKFGSFPKLELSICSIKNTFDVLLLKAQICSKETWSLQDLTILTSRMTDYKSDI